MSTAQRLRTHIYIYIYIYIYILDIGGAEAPQKFYKKFDPRSNLIVQIYPQFAHFWAPGPL